MKIMDVENRDKLRTSSVCRWLSMSKNLIRRIIAASTVSSVLWLSSVLFAQNGGAQPQTAPPASDQKQDQNIPDAPSAVQPPKPAPEAPPPAQEPPSQEPPAQDQGQSPPAPEANEPPPQSAAPETDQKPEEKPPLNLRTVPEGGATKDSEGIYKLPPVQVNQVMVPVTVKDESGQLVKGLLAKDFSVLENGKKQKLNFFTSDPFALSAAVILDLGMKDVDVQRVNHTYPALEGVFSEFDEVSIYSYSNVVSQLSGWTAVGEKLSATFSSLANVRGRNNGPPVTSG